ncbi:hypothetical protein ACFL6C_03845 [Myxococcota bacterium]
MTEAIRPFGNPPQIPGDLDREEDFQIAELSRKGDHVILKLKGQSIRWDDDMLALIAHVNNIPDFRRMPIGTKILIPKLESLKARREVWTEAYSHLTDRDYMVVAADKAGMLVRDYRGSARDVTTGLHKTNKKSIVEQHKSKKAKEKTDREAIEQKSEEEIRNEAVRTEIKTKRAEAKGNELVSLLSGPGKLEGQDVRRALACVTGLEEGEERNTLFEIYGRATAGNAAESMSSEELIERGKTNLLPALQVKLPEGAFLRAKACLRDNNPDGRLQTHDIAFLGTIAAGWGTATDTVLNAFRKAKAPEGESPYSQISSDMLRDYHVPLEKVLKDFNSFLFFDSADKRLAMMYLKAPRDEHNNIPPDFDEAYEIGEKIFALVNLDENGVFHLAEGFDTPEGFRPRTRSEMERLDAAFRILYPKEAAAGLFARLNEETGFSGDEHEAIRIMQTGLMPENAEDAERAHGALVQYVAKRLDAVLSWTGDNEKEILHIASHFLAPEGEESPGKVWLSEVARALNTNPGALKQRLLRPMNNAERPLMEMALQGVDLDTHPAALAEKLRDEITGRNFLGFRTIDRATKRLETLDPKTITEVREHYGRGNTSALRNDIVAAQNNREFVAGQIPTKIAALAEAGSDHYKVPGLYEKDGRPTDAANLFWALASEDDDTIRAALQDIAAKDPTGALGHAPKVMEDYKNLTGGHGDPLVDVEAVASGRVANLARAIFASSDMDPEERIAAWTQAEKEATSSWLDGFNDEDDLLDDAERAFTDKMADIIVDKVVVTDDGQIKIELDADDAKKFEEATRELFLAVKAMRGEAEDTANTTAALVAMGVGAAVFAVAPHVGGSMLIWGGAAVAGGAASRALIMRTATGEEMSAGEWAKQAAVGGFEGGLAIVFSGSGLAWAAGTRAGLRVTAAGKWVGDATRLTTAGRYMAHLAKEVSKRPVVGPPLRGAKNVGSGMLVLGHRFGEYNVGVNMTHQVAFEKIYKQDMDDAIATLGQGILSSYGSGVATGAAFSAAGQFFGRVVWPKINNKLAPLPKEARQAFKDYGKLVIEAGEYKAKVLGRLRGAIKKSRANKHAKHLTRALLKRQKQVESHSLDDILKEIDDFATAQGDKKIARMLKRVKKDVEVINDYPTAQQHLARGLEVATNDQAALAGFGGKVKGWVRTLLRMKKKEALGRAVEREVLEDAGVEHVEELRFIRERGAPTEQTVTPDTRPIRQQVKNLRAEAKELHEVRDPETLARRYVELREDIQQLGREHVNRRLNNDVQAIERQLEDLLKLRGGDAPGGEADIPKLNAARYLAENMSTNAAHNPYLTIDQVNKLVERLEDSIIGHMAPTTKAVFTNGDIRAGDLVSRAPKPQLEKALSELEELADKLFDDLVMVDTQRFLAARMAQIEKQLGTSGRAQKISDGIEGRIAQLEKGTAGGENAGKTVSDLQTRADGLAEVTNFKKLSTRYAELRKDIQDLGSEQVNDKLTRAVQAIERRLANDLEEFAGHGIVEQVGELELAHRLYSSMSGDAAHKTLLSIGEVRGAIKAIEESICTQAGPANKAIFAGGEIAADVSKGQLQKALTELEQLTGKLKGDALVGTKRLITTRMEAIEAQLEKLGQPQPQKKNTSGAPKETGKTDIEKTIADLEDRATAALSRKNLNDMATEYAKLREEIQTLGKNDVTDLLNKDLQAIEAKLEKAITVADNARVQTVINALRVAHRLSGVTGRPAHTGTGALTKTNVKNVLKTLEEKVLLSKTGKAYKVFAHGKNRGIQGNLLKTSKLKSSALKDAHKDLNKLIDKLDDEVLANLKKTVQQKARDVSARHKELYGEPIEPATKQTPSAKLTPSERLAEIKAQEPKDVIQAAKDLAEVYEIRKSIDVADKDLSRLSQRLYGLLEESKPKAVAQARDILDKANLKNATKKFNQRLKELKDGKGETEDADLDGLDFEGDGDFELETLEGFEARVEGAARNPARLRESGDLLHAKGDLAEQAHTTAFSSELRDWLTRFSEELSRVKATGRRFRLEKADANVLEFVRKHASENVKLEDVKHLMTKKAFKQAKDVIKKYDATNAAAPKSGKWEEVSTAKQMTVREAEEILDGIPEGDTAALVEELDRFIENPKVFEDTGFSRDLADRVAQGLETEVKNVGGDHAYVPDEAVLDLQTRLGTMTEKGMDFVTRGKVKGAMERLEKALEKARKYNDFGSDEIATRLEHHRGMEDASVVALNEAAIVQTDPGLITPKVRKAYSRLVRDFAARFERRITKALEANEDPGLDFLLLERWKTFTESSRLNKLFTPEAREAILKSWAEVEKAADKLGSAPSRSFVRKLDKAIDDARTPLKDLEIEIADLAKDISPKGTTAGEVETAFLDYLKLGRDLEPLTQVWLDSPMDMVKLRIKNPQKYAEFDKLLFRAQSSFASKKAFDLQVKVKDNLMDFHQDTFVDASDLLANNPGLDLLGVVNNNLRQPLSKTASRTGVSISETSAEFQYLVGGGKKIVRGIKQKGGPVVKVLWYGGITAVAGGTCLAGYFLFNYFRIRTQATVAGMKYLPMMTKKLNQQETNYQTYKRNYYGNGNIMFTEPSRASTAHSGGRVRPLSDY